MDLGKERDQLRAEIQRLQMWIITQIEVLKLKENDLAVLMRRLVAVEEALIEPAPKESLH